jgi:hypothetical protein
VDDGDDASLLAADPDFAYAAFFPRTTTPAPSGEGFGLHGREDHNRLAGGGPRFHRKGFDSRDEDARIHRMTSLGLLRQA